MTNPRGLVSPRQHGRSDYPSWVIGVPAKIVQQIPDFTSILFAPEVTDEGILYRPVGTTRLEPPINWPINNGREPS